jgi:putative colanic acid biosynthesis acetyltransferase WcaF
MLDLKKFKVPNGFRGRSIFTIQLWNIINLFIFKFSPRRFDFFRCFILKIFGAKIGKGVIIRSSVNITYPWFLIIGNNSWIGENVELYNLGPIVIGSNTVISQKSYLCTGSHNYKKITFDIIKKPIVIGDGVWIATDVFVGPGVTIENNVIIGARSSVYSNISEGNIAFGNPCKVLKKRDL